MLEYKNYNKYIITYEFIYEFSKLSSCVTEWPSGVLLRIKDFNGIIKHSNCLKKLPPEEEARASSFFLPQFIRVCKA